MKQGPFLAAILLALAACSAETPAPPAAAKALSCAAAADGAISAEGAWLREQADANGMTAAYFTVCNGAMTPAVLTGVSTGVAGLVELHETTRDADGVVSMAPTGPITLAPGERVVFEPGGKHAMLMSLAGAVRVGDRAQLLLQFEDGSSVSVEAVAKSAVEAAADNHEGH